MILHSPRPLAMLLGACALSSACGDPTPPDAPDLTPTGWFEPDTGDYSACPDRLQSSVPEDGALDWGWRDPLQVFVTNASPVYAMRLTTAGGVVVAATITPDGTGLVYEITVDGGLEARQDYVLEVTDCGGVTPIAFTTSELGAPLTISPAELVGRTYRLDLAGGTFVQPGGFGEILAATFTDPVLVGVAFADRASIDWIGSLGFTYLGRIYQDTDLPSWSFPVSDFTESPWFDVTASEVQLVLGGASLPVTDFRFTGTMREHGDGLGGVSIVGLADTRFAGGAFGQPLNPDAVCTIAGDLGVDCVDCPDGETFCLDIEVRDVEGAWIEGLELRRTDGE